MYRIFKLRAVLLAAVVCLALFSATGYAAITASKQIAPEGKEVLILMYHSLLPDGSKASTYEALAHEFESDLKYLAAHGYQAVAVSDLIAYVHDGADLPEKPVVLTFDDGYYNNYLFAYPLLEKYDGKMSVSVIGRYSEIFSETSEKDARYTHLTWDMIQEMQASGRVEIGNHSYDMHRFQVNGRKGSMKTSESEDAYKRVFTGDTLRAQKLLIERAGCIPVFYTYPFGFVSAQAEDYLKEMGFLASLSAMEGKNYLTRDPNGLFKLRRYLRPGGMDTEKFFKKIGAA